MHKNTLRRRSSTPSTTVDVMIYCFNPPPTHRLPSPPPPQPQPPSSNDTITNRTPFFFANNVIFTVLCCSSGFKRQSPHRLTPSVVPTTCRLVLTQLNVSSTLHPPIAPLSRTTNHGSRPRLAPFASSLPTQRAPRSAQRRTSNEHEQTLRLPVAMRIVRVNSLAWFLVLGL